MRSSSRPRILLVHISPGQLASFVQTDVELLSTIGDVRPMFFGSLIDIPRLTYEIARANLIFCWFAWSQAYWATRISRILHKPSIVVAGGFEVVSYPEIDYGGLLQSRSAGRVRLAIETANEVLAVSTSIREDVVRLSRKVDVRVVPLGFDPMRHPVSGVKERLAITVGSVTKSNLARKGISAFLELARCMPDVEFAVIGSVDLSIMDSMESHLPSNVTLTGRLSDDHRDQWMRRAKVYVQLSAHEGFGSAVAEAMLAGCIPVVANRGALPEVVGDAGIVVPWGDLNEARKSITLALSRTIDASYRCRERITHQFPLDRRRQALSEIALSLLAS